MKRILITGGSGFIGSNLKNNLSVSEFQVLTIGRSKSEDISVDLNEPQVAKIIKDFLPDIVCHFASGSNITRAEKDKEKEYKDVVLATKNFLDCFSSLSKKPEKLIYLSSQAVYGVPDYLPVAETHPLVPFTVYGKNKLQAEELIKQSKLNYLIFRVSSVYGKKQNYKKSGVVASFINKMENNQSPIVFNNFNVISDLIYISDVVYVLLKTIKGDIPACNIFNLGSSRSTTLQEVLDVLYKYFPFAPKPKVEKNPVYPDSEHKGLYLDTKKLETHLNWKPKYSIEDGLRDMLENVKSCKV